MSYIIYQDLDPLGRGEWYGYQSLEGHIIRNFGPFSREEEANLYVSEVQGSNPPPTPEVFHVANEIRVYLKSLSPLAPSFQQLYLYVQAGVTKQDFESESGFRSIEQKISQNPEIDFSFWAPRVNRVDTHHFSRP